MIVGVSSYSFHRLIRAGECRLIDTPILAREAGADAVEFALGGSLSPPLDVNLARDLAAAAGDAGMPITGVCTAAELLRGNRDAAIHSVLQQLEAVAAMGVRRFRHYASIGPENGDVSDAAFEQALPVLARACLTIAERASELGLRSSVENHARFLQHWSRIVRLVEQVDNPAFGVTLDIGNSLFAPQDPIVGAARLAPFAITVHVKDFEIIRKNTDDPSPAEGIWSTYPGGPNVRGCVVGEGDLNARACIDTIRRAGFDGPWIVEYEGPLEDPRTAAARGVDNLRAMLAHARNLVA